MKAYTLVLGILPVGILTTSMPGRIQRQDTIGVRLAHASVRTPTLARPYSIGGAVLARASTRDASAREGGFEFGELPIRAVGLDYPSRAGLTSSARAEALPWKLDAGRSTSGDNRESERDIARLFLQPRVRLTKDVYAVLRYSELGTHENDEGHDFDPESAADGRTNAYGTKLMQRLSAGVGWEVNPNTLVKFEVGQDWFDLVDGSLFREENSKRTFFGFQLVLSF